MLAQPKSHVTSSGKTRKKAEILLAASVQNFTATLTKDGPVITPTTGCPDARILRRSNILQLLATTAKTKIRGAQGFYRTCRELKSYRGIFAEAWRNADANYNEAVRAYTQANTALEGLWTAEGKTRQERIGMGGWRKPPKI